MDEKVKDQNVLLVKEKNSDELKVVTGIEKDGKPKTRIDLKIKSFSKNYCYSAQ